MDLARKVREMIALIANWKRILYGTALTLLGTLLLVQTARIDGFLFWDGLKAENEKLTGQLVSIKEAQKLATKLAKEEKARIEAENERKAENAKADYQKRLAANNAAIQRFLRSQAGSATGNTNLPEASEATERASEDRGEAIISTDFATVPIKDLQLTAEAFAKLEAWQAWYRSVQQD